jgi:hypothetical protein
MFRWLSNTPVGGLALLFRSASQTTEAEVDEAFADLSTITSGSADSGIPVRAEKIERGRIRVMSRRRLEPGTTLKILVMRGIGGTMTTLVARVESAEPHEGGGWSLICRLAGAADPTPAPSTANTTA